MGIERRPFGRTGHMSSAVIFGAAALKNVDQYTADQTQDVLYQYGHHVIGKELGQKQMLKKVENKEKEG